MPATMMSTPVGPFRIPDYIVRHQAGMTDREVADKCFRDRFIDPFAFAELVHRGLCKRGDFERDVYRRIDEKEASHVTK